MAKQAKDVREWWLDPPEPNPVCKCEFCNDDIYDGESIYIVDGDGLIHTYCFGDYAFSYISPEKAIASKITLKELYED